MDGKEAQKPRRPLPKQPSVPGGSPIPPAQFYATPQPSASSSSSSTMPPPLPTRPSNPGSSRTVYHAPTSPPPAYASAEESSPFREPELITEEPISTHEDIPDLIPSNQAAWYDPDWANTGGPTWNETNAWQHTAGEWPTHPFEGGTGYIASAPKIVDIDGRVLEEELNWWNPAAQDILKDRPGPGILPPVLTDALHNSEHTLLSVIVVPPEIKIPTSRVASRAPSASFDPNAPSGAQGSPQPAPLPPVPLPPQPTEADLRTAVPHPHAYYCRKHNGWVIIAWRSSSVVPPLAKSFRENPRGVLPDQARRKQRATCVSDDGIPYDNANKTHHFHVYKKAVDAHKLNPPFRRSAWEKVAIVKDKRRQATITSEDTDLSRLEKMDEDQPENDEEEGDLLDLYICCQCSMYCIASAVISGVIHPKFIDEFTRERLANPPPGKTGHMAVVMAWETILRILESKLWKGETRALPIMSSNFQQKLGWTPATEKVFNALGYHVVEMATEDKRLVLEAPPIDVVTPEGKHYRAKLLRAWVELNVWLHEFTRMSAKHLGGFVLHKIWVKVDSAREHYQRELGAHPEQLPRGHLPEALALYQPIAQAWGILGLTATTYTDELLAFAYLAQCRCDPAHTISYFSQLVGIAEAMQDLGEVPSQGLQALIMEERSRNRFTFDEHVAATKTLGFGRDGQLRVEFDDDVEEDFIANAWKDAVRRAWRDPEHSTALLRDANEAFRIIAEMRGSVKLRQMWEAGGGVKMMTPERAYDVLEVPKDVDETMLLTVFALRVQEHPAQLDKWREALSVIAEVRDSERLRQFLETGRDPGDILTPTPQDLPRGLNQLGNTCYLNSLLQYFYTIRELREAVAPMANSEIKSIEYDKLTDDDLKRHRVGGRLVTRREISRSKKFVSHLADLFWQMEYCETAAVTPALELAKLALVTSRDEEEDEADKGGTDSSNDTDATLVEDIPSRFPPSDPPPSAPGSLSVLGKRPRNGSQPSEPTEVDSPLVISSPDTDGFTVISHRSPPGDLPPALVQAGPSNQAQASPQDNDGDVVMSEGRGVEGPSQKPPLPSRKAEVSDSVMMFGRQHDVSECMDNCMFQIETALLKFDEMSGSQSSKISVVKRLFYGKLRQRITVPAADQRSRYSLHEKEDIFSHLPVNVSNDGIDLYDGLSCYFDDSIEFEGKKSRMEVSLVELPPLLQIQLQRVQFNRETLQPYKSQAYVKFGETISMDRFLDDADPAKKTRSKSIQANLNACRERIQVVAQGIHTPYDVSLAKTLEFLSREESLQLPEVDEELISQINDEQAYVQAELAELRATAAKLKQELEDMWRDDNTAAYELTSVFVHRGASPSWGHYFFYSRHLPEHPDSWFKYNDSEVTRVSKEEVLADTTGSTANPYLLVFARKDVDVIDTVKRFDPTTLEESEA